MQEHTPKRENGTGKSVHIRVIGTPKTSRDFHRNFVEIRISVYVLYRRNGRSLGSTRYRPGSGRILLDDVDCAGHETQIGNCPHRGWGISNCRHHEDVAIACDDGPNG